ncbi:MAG: hypothetical protein ACE5KG_05105 [Nitrososphaerales archaeon]
METFYSLRTVKWDDDDNSVVLIDQTKLPTSLTFVKCQSLMDIVQSIKKMVVRGAPAIGVTAAMGLALVAARNKGTGKEIIRELESATRELVNTRPTAVNISWATEVVLNEGKSAEKKGIDIRQAVKKRALLMAEEDVAANLKMGEYGSKLVQDGDGVLTHCK